MTLSIQSRRTFFSAAIIFLLAQPSQAFEWLDRAACFYAFPPKLQDGVYPHHYRPERNVDYQRLVLEIKTHMDEQRVSGRAHYTFKALYDGVDYVRLDAVDMAVHNVSRSGGPAVEWNHADNAVHIHFQTPLQEGEEAAVAVHYSAEPQQNLWFTDPEHVAPKNPDQLYTLSEPFGASRWFPSPDYPDDRLLTEMKVTVPSHLESISNGVRVDSQEEGEWRTDHWKMEAPQVIYLVSLVVGDFEVVEQEWRGIPVQYYVMPGYEDDALPSMGMTPEMLTFMSDYLDYPYPYEKYAQVMVRQFRAGGMEHTTATTMMEGALVTEDARLDYHTEWLIAHELAHQWFGDLLTCQSWGELWLNEGFASYFESLWAEHARGEDDFLHHVWDDMQSYINSSRSYTRPIVTNRFADPTEMFDSHSYPKGASVLHMLRSQLGDALFQKSLRRYLKTNEYGLVDTDDLMDAIDAATGQPMDRFFEQWIYRPGHPKLEVAHEWLADKQQVKVTLKQSQEMKKGAPAFAFPLEIEIVTEDGRFIETVQVDQKEETAFIDSKKAPQSVVIDPSIKVLMELDHKKPLDMLLRDLEHGSTIIVRMRAAETLGQYKQRRVVEALAQAMNEDDFYAVQQKSASALGTIHTPYALRQLTQAVDHPTPRTRQAIAKALGEFFQNQAAYEALVNMFRNDESIFVAVNAARALAKVDLESGGEVLGAGLNRDSYEERIRRAGLGALVTLKAPDAWPAIKQYAQDPHYYELRQDAIRAMGRFAYETESHQEEALKTLLQYLQSQSGLIQQAAIDGLEALKNQDAIPHLRRVAQRGGKSGPFVDLGNEAQNAIEVIRSAQGENLPGKNQEKIQALEEKQEELESTIRELQESLKELKGNSQ